MARRQHVTIVLPFLTEKSQQLRPAGLVLDAADLLVVSRQVMKLEQVDDGDVDQLLGAEGLLQNQPLHAHASIHKHTRTQSQHPKSTAHLACTVRSLTWKCSSSRSLRESSLSTLLLR